MIIFIAGQMQVIGTAADYHSDSGYIDYGFFGDDLEPLPEARVVSGIPSLLARCGFKSMRDRQVENHLDILIDHFGSEGLDRAELGLALRPYFVEEISQNIKAGKNIAKELNEYCRRVNYVFDYLKEHSFETLNTSDTLRKVIAESYIELLQRFPNLIGDSVGFMEKTGLTLNPLLVTMDDLPKIFNWHRDRPFQRVNLKDIRYCDFNHPTFKVVKELYADSGIDFASLKIPICESRDVSFAFVFGLNDLIYLSSYRPEYEKRAFEAHEASHVIYASLVGINQRYLKIPNYFAEAEFSGMPLDNDVVNEFISTAIDFFNQPDFTFARLYKCNVMKNIRLGHGYKLVVPYFFKSLEQFVKKTGEKLKINTNLSATDFDLIIEQIKNSIGQDKYDELIEFLQEKFMDQAKKLLQHLKTKRSKGMGPKILS